MAVSPFPTRPSALGPSPVQKMTSGPLYVIPGPTPGLHAAGNINLLNRPKVPNWNPSQVDNAVYPAFSSVNSMTRVDPRTGKAVLFPSVVGNKILNEDDAWSHYIASGKHLGVFDSIPHANLYARLLHLQQQGAMK